MIASTTRFAVSAMAAGIAWSIANQCAFAQAPTEAAGMLEVPDRVGVGFAPVYLWEPARLYERVLGSPTTEILDPSGFPMTNIRGIASVPNSGHPLGSSAFIWRDQGVFHHMPTAINSAVEIVDPNGNPIGQPRGVVWTANLSGASATGSDAWIWNGAGLFLHQPPTTGTVEITGPAGFPLTDIRAVVGTLNTNPAHPTGEDVWVYNQAGTYHHQTGSTSTAEITDGIGNSLSNVRGIIGTLDVTSSTGSAVFIWNGQGIFLHQVGTTQANEITAGGGSISDIRGVITFMKAPSPTQSGVLFWNPSGVFFHQTSTLNAVQFTTPLFQPISNTRGIVATPSATSATGTDLWIWSGAAVYLHVPGSTTTVEILDPGGAPIVAARGIIGVADNSGLNPTGTAVFIYTDSQVLVHQVGTTSTSEIIDTNGNSLADVRGVMSTSDSTSPTGSSTWIWNGAGVHLHQVGTTQSVEITDQAGFAIANPWGMIASADGTSITGSAVWVRTDSSTFRHLPATTQAEEIQNPLGGPIPSPVFLAPSSGLAVVHNIRQAGGGEGAGTTQADPPFPVSFAGQGAGQSVERSTTAPPCPMDLTTMIAGTGLQLVHSPGPSVLQNDHVAVLMIPSPEMPVCGACCDATGQCTDFTTAATCQGTYHGDGSTCLGDFNPIDGFDDLCGSAIPPSGYEADDGTGDANEGIQHPGGSGDKHWMAWLNGFALDCGKGTRVTHVKVAFGSIPIGSSADIYVWEDPNVDQDPDDAAVVSQLIGAITSQSNSNTFDVFDIPDVIITTGYFFVGVVMRHDHGLTPARIDTDGTDTVGFYDPLDGESWVVGTVNDQMIDPHFLAKPTYDLTLRSTVDPSFNGGNWMVRAVTSLGACCEPGGACSIVSECECTSPTIAGVYQGDGVMCLPDPCSGFVDCNANGFDDADDLATGRSSDVNGNGIPDECEVTLPADLQSEPGGVDKNRFVSIVVPQSAARGLTAIRIGLTSLHHPPNPPAGTPDFSAVESTYRYVNAFLPLQSCVGGSNSGAACASQADCPGGSCVTQLHTCPDSAALGSVYRCAQLGCQPEYRDWAAELAGKPLHVTAEWVAPSSAYDLSQIRPICGSAPAADTCTASSGMLTTATSLWADVCGPGIGPPDGSTNVLDISCVVDKVKDLPGALPEPRIWLKQQNPDPLTQPVNVIDIAYVVDSVKRVPYPFQMAACP